MLSSSSWVVVGVCSDSMFIWSGCLVELTGLLRFLLGLFYQPVSRRFACLIKAFASLKYMGVIVVRLYTNCWIRIEGNQGQWLMDLGVLVIWVFHLMCI